MQLNQLTIKLGNLLCFEENITSKANTRLFDPICDGNRINLLEQLLGVNF